jgi:hypothetical protein
VHFACCERDNKLEIRICDVGGMDGGHKERTSESGVDAEENEEEQ